MGRDCRKILFIMSVLFFFNGCSRETELAQTEQPAETITGFTLKQFAEKTSFVVSGETAEIEDSAGTTSVTQPDISLTTSHEIIEITTGADGKAQVNLDPSSKTIKNIVIEKDVLVIYRDITTGLKTMEATCQLLTYSSEKGILVMEGSPVIKRGPHTFSGDTIDYHLETNSIEIKGKVNVQFHPETPISD